MMVLGKACLMFTCKKLKVGRQIAGQLFLIFIDLYLSLQKQSPKNYLPVVTTMEMLKIIAFNHIMYSLVVLWSLFVM